MITDIGTAVLPPDELNQANSLRSEMERIYSTATVCDRPGDDDPTVCYPLDPGTCTLPAPTNESHVIYCTPRYQPIVMS